MKMSLVRRLSLISLLVLGTAVSRADEEQDLIATLQSQAGTPAKNAACLRLGMVGSASAVPALTPLLHEDATAHAARAALEKISAPEAVAALRQAMVKASGSLKAGLVDSLGVKRDAEAVRLIEPLLSDTNTMVASSAATALGRIGTPQATAALSSLEDRVEPGVRPAFWNSLLERAEALRVEGDAPAAAALCRGLVAAGLPDHVRAAAWRALALADPSQRVALASRALTGVDRPIHAAALSLLRELNDADLVEAVLRQWSALPSDAQLAVLDARIKLGVGALPAVITATTSPHETVRVAAWQALGELGDAGSIAGLAKTAAAAQAAERAAARDALAQVRGPGIRDALLRDLAQAAPPEKAELLLALGRRNDRESVGLLLENAAGGPEPVCVAALESLKLLGLPETAAPLVEIAARAKSETDRERVLGAVYAACQNSPDKEQTSRAVLAAMNRLQPSQRASLLPVLAELGTTGALDSARAAAQAPDPELKKEAISVLAQWPNASAAPVLLDLARSSTDATVKVLALRAGIAIAGQEPDLKQRLELLRQALAAAGRVEEKKQVLGQIGQVPTREALQAILPLLADDGLADEAALAAVTVAEKLARTNPKLAREAGARVVAQCKSPELVKRAQALRDRPPASR